MRCQWLSLNYYYYLGKYMRKYWQPGCPYVSYHTCGREVWRFAIYFLSEGPRLISIYIVQKGWATHMTEEKKILVRAKFNK